MHEAVPPEIDLNRSSGFPIAIGTVLPPHLAWLDLTRSTTVENSRELDAFPRMNQTGVLGDRPLRRRDVYLAVRPDIEGIAFVRVPLGGFSGSPRAPVELFSSFVQEWNRIAVPGHRDDPDVVPALFPFDLVQTRERDDSRIIRGHARWDA